MALEFRPRAVRILLVGAAGLGLISCGGGGGGKDEVKAPPPPTPVQVGPAPVLPPTTLPLHIDGFYITQRSQRRDQSVPLVKDQAGMLRVFVTANHWSGPGPEVEVRILEQGGTVHAERIPAPAAGVPRALNEAQVADSWNLRLPGRLIQPGNAVQVKLLAPPGVPTGNLEYPEDGSALPMKVVEVAPLRLTLVPVASGTRVGQVDTGGRTVASWLEVVKRHLPLGRIQVRVAEVFRTGQDLDTDQGLDALLDEIEVLRQADGGGDDQYFYGVYPTSPGVRLSSGRGFTKIHPDRELRVAIGCDVGGQRPGFNYPDFLAHELGHNLGLRHAPCGTTQWPKNVDSRFPYADGGIGACGFDVRAGEAKDPAVFKDFMSYCEPAWCSDYDCRAVLAFRAGEPLVPPRPGEVEEQDGLLVQGLLTGDRVSLLPAFQLHRPPLVPESGEYVLSALDPGGRILESVPFAILPASDEPEGAADGAFTFVLPMTRAMKDGLATLRVTRDGVVMAERHAAARRAGPGPVLARDSHGWTELRWDAQSYPEAMLKDPRTGHVLALGSSGRLRLKTRARQVDGLFSDGLHTMMRRLQVGH